MSRWAEGDVAVRTAGTRIGRARVAVVVPTCNRADYLPAAVASVLRQTLAGLEIVIVDDGSTDSTPEVAATLVEADSRVKAITQPNRGLAAARNTGLRHTTADWVAFLDDDDLLHPDFTEAMLEFATATAGRAAACWAVTFDNEDPGADPVALLADPRPRATLPWPPTPPTDDQISLLELLLRPLAPINAGLFRRDWLLDRGGFDTGLSAAEDYALWLDLACIEPVPVLPRPLALVRRHPRQMTRSLARMARETRRALLRFAARHPDRVRQVGRVSWRRRLGSLAREEAYAELREGRRGRAARAALSAVRQRPGDLKSWVYLALAPMPALYRKLKKLPSRRHPPLSD